MNETINIQAYNGNTKISHKKSKFEMVSAHTARRTFATILYLNSAPIKFIMEVTGHKKESTFLKYIRLKGKDAISILNSFM